MTWQGSLGSGTDRFVGYPGHSRPTNLSPTYYGLHDCGLSHPHRQTDQAVTRRPSTYPHRATD